MTARPGDTFTLMNSTVTVLATADQTDDAWEAVQIDIGPGGRSPLHTLSADKLFHVVGGAVTFRSGDRTTTLDSGSLFVPAGVEHNYVNDSGAPARIAVTVTGRGQVDFLAGMSRLTAGGPPDPDELAAHTRRSGVTILPA